MSSRCIRPFCSFGTVGRITPAYSNLLPDNKASQTLIPEKAQLHYDGNRSIFDFGSFCEPALSFTLTDGFPTVSTI